MIAAELTAFANTDLSAARRFGHILIGQTKRGTLALEYSRGVYTLTPQGAGAEILVRGKAGTVRPVLVGLYDVQKIEEEIERIAERVEVVDADKPGVLAL